MPSERSGIDLVAYDREGQVVLLAEAKSRHGASKHWAARLRRNMLSHGVLPWAKYFLIATPERMYLWKQKRPSTTEVPPEFTVDASKVFQPYFQRLHLEPSDIGHEAFELLVLTWLTDIAQSDENRLDPRLNDSSSALVSELSGSLHHARIEMNPTQ